MENKPTLLSIAGSLLVFTVPLILSGLFQQLFNWVDAFIVGNVQGEAALAGIGATTSIYNLFVTVITGFTSGFAVLSAQQYGKGEKKKINEALSLYSLLLVIVFGACAAAGVRFSGNILSVMNTPENIFELAESYLRIMFIGIPFLAVYNTYSAVLRGVGNSRAPFFSVVGSSVANGVLDIVFVAKLGYGTAGAAAATVIAQFAMTLFIVIYTYIKYPFLRFSLPKKAEDKTVFGSGMRFGLPSAVQSGVSSIGNVYLQQFMNGFGEQTVAAITTAYRVDTVIFLPIINFSSGIATMVAQNIGAGDQVQAKKIFRIGTVIMAAISIVLTLLVLLTGKYLIGIFGLSPESTELGDDFFHSIAVFYIIYGLGMAVRGYLEGNGDMLFSGVAGILALAVRIICSYAFEPLFNNMVVAYAEAFSWIFLLVLLILRYRRRYRRWDI